MLFIRNYISYMQHIVFKFQVIINNIWDLEKRIIMDNEIKLFEGNQIRLIWDNERKEGYFNIVYNVGVLIESKNPRRYRGDLKKKLKDEVDSAQLYENIVQLKLKVPDGNQRETDVADLQGIFHIIQSVPYPKVKSDQNMTIIAK